MSDFTKISFKEITITLFVVLIISLILPWLFTGYGDLNQFISNITTILLNLFTAIVLIFAAWWSRKNSPTLFKPWLLLGVGQSLYVLADVLYFVYQSIFNTIPFPSLADVFFLAYYPFFAIGLYLMLNKPLRIRSKSFLDTAIIVSSTIFIMWFLLIWPTILLNEGDLVAIILSLVYISLDFILLFFGLNLLLNWTRKTFGIPVIFITSGMFAVVIGDIIYTYYALNPIFLFDWLSSCFYLISYVCIALAGIAFIRKEKTELTPFAELFTSWKIQRKWLSYLPLFLVLFAYGLLIYSSTPSPSLIWGVGIIVVMVIVRQFISLEEIKHAQEKLSHNKNLIEKKEQQLSFITTNMMDLITECDFDGIYKYVSPSAFYILGYQPEDLLGTHFLKYIHPDDIGPIKKILNAKSIKRASFRYKDVTGEYIWIETVANPIFDENGVFRGFISSSRDITRQRESEEFIKESLKEKDMMLKEIHHRVKNNLQVISSLLSLQSHHVKHKDDMELFIESQNRVKSMAIIHEKIYQSENLSKINFKEYLQTIAQQLLASYLMNDQVKLNLNCEDINLGLETAIPCGLLTNELITNSMKHAFPQGRKGQLNIQFESRNDEYLLTISDDGVGLPTDFDLSCTDSLGLKIVQSLVRQLDGDLEINNSIGAEFKLHFKDMDYPERF